MIQRNRSNITQDVIDAVARGERPFLIPVPEKANTKPRLRLKPIRIDKARVALLTPTQNRSDFLPWVVRCFKAFDRSTVKRIRWYVLDDSDESNEALLRREVGEELWGTVRYRHVGRMLLGKKRNAICEWAFEERNDIFVALDDDDWYGPQWPRIVTTALCTSTFAALAGSSRIYLYYPNLDKLGVTLPIHPRHSCNGLLSFRREYWEAGHRYEDSKTFGEEHTFTDNFSEPMIVLPDPRAYNVAINHGRNTFDKEQIFDRRGQIVRKIEDGTRIEDLVPPEFAAFYRNLDIPSGPSRPGPRLFRRAFGEQNLQDRFRILAFPSGIGGEAGKAL